MVPVVVLGRVYVVPRLAVVLRLTVEVLRPVEMRSVVERVVFASRVPTTLFAVLLVVPCVRFTVEWPAVVRCVAERVAMRFVEEAAPERVTDLVAKRLGLFRSLITVLRVHIEPLGRTVAECQCPPQ